MLNRLPDLFQCNLRLRLELDLFWNSCLASPLRIARPYLRQIQAPGNRQTRIPRTERQTHSHATVVLLTNLSTILARYSYRMTSFFGKPGVIDDPRHHPDRSSAWPAIPDYTPVPASLHRPRVHPLPDDAGTDASGEHC